MRMSDAQVMGSCSRVMVRRKDDAGAGAVGAASSFVRPWFSLQFQIGEMLQRPTGRNAARRREGGVIICP